MNRKYITAVVLGLLTIIGWNAFLIQRDEKLYGSYYRSKALENLKSPPSNQIK